MSFETRWEYDSWNRVNKIVYPDADTVFYTYDQAGKLFSVYSHKQLEDQLQVIPIIDTIRYDKFERREYMSYGNGTRMRYSYDPNRGFLTGLTSLTSQDEYMQNNFYVYDQVGNLASQENTAGSTSGGFGGASDFSYTYDNLYRLTAAEGSWQSGTKGSFNMNLSMTYGPSGKITSKTQTAEILDAGENMSMMDISHTYVYNEPQQPNTIREIQGIGHNQSFEWDANGNMVYHHDEGNSITQRLCWDEINRLIATSDGSQISHYIYDANGERAMKYNGTLSKIQQNKYTLVDCANMGQFTYYINPLMTVSTQEYTKHYFIEGQRVMSKIGAGMANNLMDMEDGAYDYIMSALSDSIKNQLAASFECLSLDGIAVFNTSIEPILEMANQNNHEFLRYFYHPDHLGSSSFITDATGEPTQHLEYLPFGELFIEERSTWNTPYKFSGKELDDETGYSYFGARYYDPNISIWGFLKKAQSLFVTVCVTV